MATPAPVPAGPRPAWSRLVGVFDLETTGVSIADDRIVTAFVGLLDAAGTVVAQRHWLADPGIDIPDAAAAIHGVTSAHARAAGRPAGDVVGEVVEYLRGLFDAAVPVVAYNAAFDFSLLDREAHRHGIRPLASPAPVIDPLVIDKAFDRWRRGKRTLEHVAGHYAVGLDAAHDASEDAVAAGRVALALAERFAVRLPPSADDLHVRQIAWARSQAASLTEYFIRIGRLDPPEALDGAWPVR